MTMMMERNVDEIVIVETDNASLLVTWLSSLSMGIWKYQKLNGSHPGIFSFKTEFLFNPLCIENG